MKPSIQVVRIVCEPFVRPSNLDVYERALQIPLPIDPFKFVEKIEAMQTSTKGVE